MYSKEQMEFTLNQPSPLGSCKLRGYMQIGNVTTTLTTGVQIVTAVF